MADIDELTKRVNDLTAIVNQITKESFNIDQFEQKTPLDGNEEIAVTSEGGDYKILVSQLLAAYQAGTNININGTIINTVSDPVFNEQTLVKLTDNPLYQEGKFWYDGNFNFYDAISGTSMQLCKEMNIDVYNNNGTDCPNFTAVIYDTPHLGLPTIKKGLADTLANSKIIGLTTHNIAVGSMGKVTTQGAAGGDTSMWNVNDTLYLSATVPGGITNIPQQISVPVAIVLISDTEENGGLIYIYPRGVTDILAIGQASGLIETMALTTVPQKLESYGNTLVEVNIDINQTGTGPYTAECTPNIIEASGYYRVSFSCSLTGSVNTTYNFELYKNGINTGLKTVIDLTNNNINSGSSSFDIITNEVFTDQDILEIYASVGSGTANADFDYTIFNIERLGNI